MENVNPYSSPNTLPSSISPQDDVRYAGFWLRVRATIIDVFILIVLDVILRILTFSVGADLTK